MILQITKNVIFDKYRNVYFSYVRKVFFSSIVNNILISLLTSVPRAIGTLCLMTAFKIKNRKIICFLIKIKLKYKNKHIITMLDLDVICFGKYNVYTADQNFVSSILFCLKENWLQYSNFPQKKSSISIDLHKQINKHFIPSCVNNEN